MRVSYLVLCLGVMLPVMAPNASAQLVSESFNQPPGTLGGQGGGAGWGNNWTNATGTEFQVSASGLTYSNLAVSGGMVQDASSVHSLSVASRSLGDRSSNFVDGATLWFSFLIRPGSTFTNWGMAIAASNGSGTSGGFGMNVNSTGFTARAGSVSSATQSFTWTNGATYLVVGSMQVSTTGNETTTIWVNPVLGGGSPTGGSFATASGNIGTLPGANAFFAFQGGNQGQLFALDEIRFGSSFGGVTPTSAIPEPSTASAIAGCVVACVAAVLRRVRLSEEKVKKSV